MSVRQLDGLFWPTADGSANQVLKNDGSGALSWSTPSTSSSTVTVTDNENTDEGNALIFAADADLDGGTRQSVLVTASTGFKGHNLETKTKGGEKKRFRYKPDGMRKRRYFRGNTITQDTRQINLKVVESATKSLEDILGGEKAAEESSE